MALGEASHEVCRRVVLDAFRAGAAGLAIGSVFALACGTWLRVFLVGVTPYDGRMIAAAAGLLAVVIIVAAYGPARQAARVDPVTALRSD